MIKEEFNSPKKGMNRHTHPSENKASDYTFILNGNIQDVTGDGDFIVENEPSNIKCSSLKPGYIVLKQKYDRVRERVYLFLVNEETGCSEIGYISAKEDFDINEVEELICNCDTYASPEIPLEEIFQEDRCDYTTVLSDYCTEEGVCTGCLNFSTKHPILNIVIRHSILGDELYWNDGFNPDRYIKLYDIDSYFQDVNECEGEITPTCLQCDKLRIFTLFDRPCILPVAVGEGGALRAGVYTVFIAYSDIDGTEVSDYFTGTNLISIFDSNNTILDQTQLDYRTNKSIQIRLSNLDPTFSYYKVVVGISTGNDPGIVYKTYGVFPIDQQDLTISQIASSTESNSDNPQSGNNLNIFDILSVRPYYLNSKLMTSANGYLFLGNLEGMREINLQPVVNLLGSAVKWGSGIAYEDLYEYGESTAKYKTYHRDEGYPLGIRFLMKGGYVTALHPFIARPPFPEEIEVMPDDNNRRSIEENIDTCGDYERDKVWQFVNTAQNEGSIPCESTADSEEVVVPEIYNCTTEITFETGDGVFSTDIGEPLITWINSNIPDIIVSTDPELSEMQDALSDPLFYGNCVPDTGENCDNSILNSEEILAVEIVNEQLTEVSIPYDEYDPIPPPTECDRLVEPQDHDLTIEAIIGAGSTVWKKTANTNTSCSSSTQVEDYNGAPLFGSYHLIDIGSTVSSSDLYDTSIPVSLTDNDFKPFLHKNAIWFKVPFFNNSGRIIAQLSEVVCGIIDDNTNNKIRITIFDGCPTLVEKPAYGVIINDATIVSSDLFIDLDSSDFTGSQLTAYIAIDSPMKSEMEIDLTFSGNSGDGEIMIEGEVLPVVFNTDINTTALNFTTTNSTVLTTLGITVSVSMNIVTLIMSEDQYLSLLWTQLNPDINVVFSLISQKHLLQPPCGCFAMYRRIPTLRTVITYDNIIFAKKQTYTYQCTYDKIGVKKCDVAPREEGLFSYMESTLRYPCNPELYDSSGLEIAVNRIPSSFQTEFEGYYVSGISGGNYILNTDTNFMDKPIRHYKFPDNAVSPFMQKNNEDVFGNLATNSFISPIGFRIDNEIINAFLDVAVDNELLSQEERDQITGYELFRGDRATDRSVIAKGLLFDMRKYEDLGRNQENTFYPNYPLNHSETDADVLNGRLRTSKTDNYFYTFHSPETHFEKPSLPGELYIDSYQLGVSTNKFAPVKDHVTWVILGRKARQVATSLATAEIAFEIIMSSANLLTMAAAGGISAIVAAIIAAVWIVVIALTLPNKFARYKYEWLQTFENLGNPFNFAYYGIAQGVYKSLLQNKINSSKLRGLELSSYLKSGRKYLSNEKNTESLYINNYNREDSVALKFNEAYKLSVPLEYSGKDNSMYNIPTSNTGILGDYIRKTASPYGSIKRYVPNQYGSLNSISWLSTGYCGDLTKDSSCDIVFGGDIFISRFAVKRKFPFFTENAIGLPPNTPYKYSSFYNVNTGSSFGVRGYVDFKTSNEIMNSGFYEVPENNSELTLWNGATWVNDVNEFYVKDEYKFLIFYYGFPYYLVESEFNCNYRYAGIEMKEDFYPNLGDTVEYTQEVNVSIREPNVFKYNSIYSNRQHKSAYRLLPVDFSKNLSIVQTDLDDVVIASNQDNEDSSKLRSPWLNYQPADFYRFKKSYGSLIDIKGIESEMLWVRFTDGYEILNAIDVLAERVTDQTRRVGLSGMFRQRALNFNVTDLGYNGTQHRETISTEFGHYSVDAKRGKIFELSPGAKGVNEVSQSMDKWFKEQLPFKILKKFPNVNVDNQYNGIGISMGWDDRTKRFLLTKRDYIPTSKDLLWSEEDGFYVEELNGEGRAVKVLKSLLDEDYFEPAHWTTAYSPLTKMWVAYYSFHPFYYITLNDHFKTGMNLLGDDKNGIWSHYPLVSSYQVFYGELFPFIIEYSLPMNGNMSSIDYIEFLLDTKKYYNKFDFSNILGKGFNKAYIYNDKRNSGELELITHNKESRKELTEYPKYTSDSVKILQYQNNDFWTFNYLFDHVKDINSRLPIWLNDNVDVLKELNPLSMNYKNSRRDKIRGDFFVIRLIQDEDSRNKLAFRLSKGGRNYYV